MHNDPVLSMLGIAAKSGNVVSGEFSTEKSVKTGKGFLVLVAAKNRSCISRDCLYGGIREHKKEFL